MTEPLPSAALDIVIRDPWTDLAASTPARLTLGRAGAALPSDQVLALAMAHAKARDAVYAAFEPASLAHALHSLGQDAITVESAAATRDIYLRRPDLGRRLSDSARKLLESRRESPADISIVIADGLSATAVHENAMALVAALLPLLESLGRSLSLIVLARQARVALGDEVGQVLGSGMSLVLIGERPGLSAADSLGAYLTFGPRVGCTDAERNCVSNIRPKGLAPAQAAAKIGWLVERAFARSLTGVLLKDESDGILAAPGPAGIPGIRAKDRS